MDLSIDWSTAISSSRKHLDELALLSDIYWYDTIEKLWQPGEQGAADRLATFIAGASGQYRDDRNITISDGDVFVITVFTFW